MEPQQTEALPPAQEHAAEKDRSLFREGLKREALSALNAVAEDDSLAYRDAALDTAQFVDTMLTVADVMERQLQQPSSKLDAQTRDLYERAIAEAESNAITLPLLLQQTRITQYLSDTQSQLNDISRILEKREELRQWVEKARTAILQSTTIGGEKMHPSVVAYLASIADTSWRLRERLSVPPNMRRYVDALDQKAEPAFKETTKEVEQTMNKSRKQSENARRSEGAERITQGFPGAEMVLDTPKISIIAWKKLLTAPTGPERARNARFLREYVEHFDHDFLKKETYKEFEHIARVQKDIHETKNESIRGWFTLFGIRRVGKVATTPDEDFERVYTEVTKAVEARFDGIIASKEAASVQKIKELLKKLEAGEDVNNADIESLLDDYGQIQENTDVVMSDVQRWMVAENIGTPDNPVEGRGHMLGHVTRVEGKTALTTLREHSPYGVWRKRSIFDEHTNRVILLPLPESYYYRDSAIMGGVLTVVPPILARIPLLTTVISKLPFPWWARAGGVVSAVAVAEAAHKTTEKGAAMVQVSMAQERVRNALTLLSTFAGQTLDDKSRQAVQAEAVLLFEGMNTLLHAVQKDSFDTVDPALALEAHVYTNQLLMALGLPPYHQLSASVSVTPSTPVSPEVQSYLQVHTKDERTRTKETTGHREARYAQRLIVQQQLLGLRAEVGTPLSPDNPVTAILAGKVPSVARDASSTDAMQTAMREAMAAIDTREVSPSDIDSAQHMAGDVHYAAKSLRRLGYSAVKEKEGGGLFSSIMSGTPFISFERWDRNKWLEENPANREREYDFSGHKVQLKAIETTIQRLLAENTFKYVARAAKILNEHPPSNRALATVWLKEEYPAEATGIRYYIANRRWGTDKTLNQLFGDEKHRTGMGEKLIEDYLCIYFYAKYFGLTPDRQ